MDSLTLTGNKNAIYINGATAEKAEKPTVQSRFPHLGTFCSNVPAWEAYALADRFEEKIGRVAEAEEVDALINSLAAARGDVEAFAMMLAGEALVLPMPDLKYGHFGSYMEVDVSGSSEGFKDQYLKDAAVLLARLKTEQKIS